MAANKKSTANKLIGGQGGAIIVLLTVLIIPLILLLALSIDTSRLSSSSTQQKRLSRAVALAALEGWTVNRLGGFTYAELADKARERALDVARLQSNQILVRNASRAEPGESDQVVELQFGRWWAEQPLTVLNGQSVGACPTWPDNLDDSCPCPRVGDTRDWDGPCFEADPPSASNIDAVSAVHAQLRTDEEAPSRSLFGSLVSLIGGQQEVLLRSGSTAAIVPRVGVFLIDLSRSTNAETHLPFERTDAADFPSEYVFPLASMGNNWWAVLSQAQRVESCAEGVNASDCYVSGNNCAIRWREMDRLYNGDPDPDGAEPFTPSPPIMQQTRYGETASTRHFRDEYSCVRPDDVDRSYLVDTHPVYGRPEPLNTILNGINAALTVIQNSAVAGDRLGVIAFDHAASSYDSDPGVGGEGSQIGGRRIPPVRPGTPEFDELLRITDVDDPGDLHFRLRRFFFPRDGANTDLSGALWQARDMLTDLAGFQQSQSFVAMFTDGLASCAHGVDTGWIKTDAGRRVLAPDYCLSPTKGNALYDRNDPQGLNLSAWSVHMRGLLEATQLLAAKPNLGQNPSDYFRSKHALQCNADTMTGPDCEVRTYQQLGIKFHLFLIGDNVVPNERLMPSSGTSGKSCAWGDDWNQLPDMRDYGLPRFWGQKFAELNGHTLFYKDTPGVHPTVGFPYSQIAQRCWDISDGSGYPAPGKSKEWFSLNCEDSMPTEQANGRYSYTFPGDFLYVYGVQPTGGMFVPVRRPCQPKGSNLADGKSCEDGGLKKFLDNQCKQGNWLGALDNLSPRITKADQLNDPAYAQALVMLAAHGSSQRRHMLICDPLCRDKNSQVTDAVRKIFESNPYSLVE